MVLLIENYRLTFFTTNANTQTTFPNFLTSLLEFVNALCADSNHQIKHNDFSILIQLYSIYLIFSVIVFALNTIVALGQVRLPNGIA